MAPRRPTPASRIVCSLLLAGLALAGPPAIAAPPDAVAPPTADVTPPAAEVADAGPPAWSDPFAESLPDPGLLSVALKAGSHHGNGIGVAVGVTLIPHLELEASYAYWSEHSIAVFLKANVLPDAPLCPYFVAGYDLAIVDLRYGINLFAHQVFGGFGFQARVAGRFFVGGEVTVSGAVAQTLAEKSARYDMGPADEPDVRAGFIAGAWLF